MTEREKMLAGELYDCGDQELIERWHKAKNLVREYNRINSENLAEKEKVLSELLGGKGKNLWITAPFFVDYGNNIYFGNNVWIGGGAIIMPGVTIGDNVVIGAGSVVTKDIPSNKIAFGNPCRIMRDNI